MNSSRSCCRAVSWNKLEPETRATQCPSQGSDHIPGTCSQLPLQGETWAMLGDLIRWLIQNPWPSKNPKHYIMFRWIKCLTHLYIVILYPTILGYILPDHLFIFYMKKKKTGLSSHMVGEKPSFNIDILGKFISVSHLLMVMLYKFLGLF